MSIPSNYTLVATYDTTINAQRGGGDLTATPVGPATIVSGKLDLAHDDVRYVYYNAVGNAGNRQKGAIKLKVTPNYSGIPVTSDYVFYCESQGISDFRNLLSFGHSVTGQIMVGINDSTGTNIVALSLGVWYAVAGTTYEMEFNYDIDAGTIGFFINGALFGTTVGGTGTRTSDIYIARVGQSWDDLAPILSNFYIEDLIIFNTVQHTAAYTPSYSLGWAQETAPTKVFVYGFLKYIDNTPAGSIRCHVTATQKYEYGNLEVYLSDVETTTEPTTGYWVLNLIENTSTSVPYVFTFYQGSTILKQFTNITVPNTLSEVDFASLVP